MAVVVYVFRDAPLWTLGGLGLFVLILALRQFGGRIGSWLGNVTDAITDPEGTVKAPGYRYVAALVLTGVATIVVNYLDPKYLKLGQLKVLDNPRKQS